MYYTPYVSAYPALWEKWIGGESVFNEMSHIGLVRKWLDESYKSIAVVQSYLLRMMG